MPEGDSSIFNVGTAQTMERLAHAGNGAVMISIDADGYAEVAGYHEQIFSDVHTALEFISQCGGRLEICAASNEPARAEILLPTCSLAARHG